MPTIVEQIQRDALNTDVSVSSLLRRVKLAAAKLGLDAVETWVDHELNGYTGEPPPYREMTGQPKAFNPYVGWVPVIDTGGHLSRRFTNQSVAELEDVIARDGGIVMPFPPKMLHNLNEENDVEFSQYSLHIDRSRVVRILDKVRNLVLDWAVALEKRGVTGTEFSFNDDEKRIAREAAVSINIGSIGSFAGILGTGNTSGDITASNINVEQVRRLVQDMRAQTQALIDGGVDGDVLAHHLDVLNSEASKSDPDRDTLKGLLADLRNALSGAAGSIVAAGAIALISQIVG